jgi:hypothetical protein
MQQSAVKVSEFEIRDAGPLQDLQAFKKRDFFFASVDISVVCSCCVPAGSIESDPAGMMMMMQGYDWEENAEWMDDALASRCLLN